MEHISVRPHWFLGCIEKKMGFPRSSPPGIRSSKNYQKVTFIQPDSSRTLVPSGRPACRSSKLEERPLIRTGFRCVSAKAPLPACHSVVIVPQLFLRNNSPSQLSFVPPFLNVKWGDHRGAVPLPAGRMTKQKPFECSQPPPPPHRTPCTIRSSRNRSNQI